MPSLIGCWVLSLSRPIASVALHSSLSRGSKEGEEEEEEEEEEGEQQQQQQQQDEDEDDDEGKEEEEEEQEDGGMYSKENEGGFASAKRAGIGK